MRPIALVIPWFGKELKGGAEQQAWQISTRLANRGFEVEVLTTCCAAFLEDWSTNHLPAGTQQLENLVVRRFKVDKRNGEMFNQANAHGLSVPQENLRPGINPFTFGTRELFVSENINSVALEKYLKKNKKKYHCFIFIPYLYGVILNGLPLVAEKSWLQPCLHDEVYAYLPEVERCMRLCRGILYNSRGEEALARKLFGPGIMEKGKVVGEGVEASEIDKDQLPPAVLGINLKEGPYVLCLGRRDATKNTSLLVEAYARFRKRYPQSNLKLLLAGPGDEKYGTEVKGVHDLGLVSDMEKEALLLNCRALFQPSKNESYSRVIMESWLYGRPVAAFSRCLATAMAVEESLGGWLAEELVEWSDLFFQVEQTDDQELLSIGEKGREYARMYANWDAVIDHYERVLGLREDGSEEENNKSKLPLRTIHQLTPGFAYGDAISNQAIYLKKFLQESGYTSKIFTEHIDPLMTREAELFNNGRNIDAQSGLIYHHSIGAGLTDFVINHPGPKTLVYHNVTPPELVVKEDPELAEKLEQGLQDLKVLAPHFPISAGDSGFNCNDLQLHGFTDPSVLPICITPEKWNIEAEPGMMARLLDGRDNILFVGRIIANKCQHDLIEVFTHYLNMYGNARLILVGGYDDEEKYYQNLRDTIRSSGLEGDVLITGKISDSMLHACYRCADLFWSMSKHEGFGVPLIEAMWFDIPVFAFSSAAVPETMGEGGVLFTDKDEPQLLAATARMMMYDDKLKNAIIAAQRLRRQTFLPESIRAKLDTLIRGWK